MNVNIRPAFANMSRCSFNDLGVKNIGVKNIGAKYGDVTYVENIGVKIEMSRIWVAKI